VAVAIACQRRQAFMEAGEPRAASHAGIVALLIGLGLYLVGLFGADVFLTRTSFVVVLGGALWFLAGRRAARIMAAPLVFLLIAIPLPSLIVNTITLPLQLVASRVAESALTLAAVPVFRDGNVLMLPSTTLEVAEACSGLRSLVSLGAIAAVLAWAGERSWWRRGALLLLTVPVAIAMNGLRIAATAVACETWGSQLASGGWHTCLGWITFVVSTLVLRSCSAGLSGPRSAALPAAAKAMAGPPKRCEGGKGPPYDFEAAV